MLKSDTGTGFINQVNCFIRQKAVTETHKDGVQISANSQNAILLCVFTFSQILNSFPKHNLCLFVFQIKFSLFKIKFQKFSIHELT